MPGTAVIELLQRNKRGKNILGMKYEPTGTGTRLAALKGEAKADSNNTPLSN